MMMLQYSTHPEPSTIFKSFLGAAAKGEAVAADSLLSEGGGACIHAPSERGNVGAFSTAAGWCAGAEQPSAASVTSKSGDSFILRGLHSRSRSRDLFPEEQDPGSSDRLRGTSMFLSGGAPAPSGTAPQQLQQHKSSADALDSSVRVGRLLNTRLRQAAPAPVSLGQGNMAESGCKHFTPGPYSRTSHHPPHDVHNRRRRQGGILHSGADAESEDAVSGGRAQDDQSVRAHPSVRKPLKHARGASHTRFDSSGDGRDARREGGERQGGGPGGPAGLPPHIPNCGDAFSVWSGGSAVACQPSPPPPPDDSSGGSKQNPADSSNCRQQLMPSSGSGTKSQASAGDRRGGGGGRNWPGPSPGCTAPPPPPQAMKAVLRSCYSDQILDNSRGLPCFKRLKAAFVSVAEVAGHPDLILPRYLNLTRELPDFHFRASLPSSQCVPLPPSASADDRGARAGGAVGDSRRGSPTQGDETGVHSHDSRGAKATAATSHHTDSSSSSSSIKPEDPSTAGLGGWQFEGAFVGRKVSASAEPVSPLLTVGADETKHPPWSRGTTAEPGGMMQEEMSEVSSVDSDDDEMEDGEVAEEAARIRTLQHQNVTVKGARLSRTDAASSGDINTSTSPACVPPWISTMSGGFAHTPRPTSQQQQVSGVGTASRSDRQLEDGQPSGMAVLDLRKEQQQELPSSPLRYGPPIESTHSVSTAFIVAEQSPPEASGIGTCSADEGTLIGRTSIQQSPSTSELTAAQQPSHVSKGIDSTGGKPYSCAGGIVVSTVENSSGFQSVPSPSSPAATRRPPETSTGGTAQTAVSPRSGLAASEGCASAALAGNRAPHLAAVAGEAQATAGSSSCVQKASYLRPIISNAGGSISTASVGTAKPRPMDPRLTRQPKLQAGQQGSSISGGTTVQDIKCTAVNAPADTVDVGVSSTGKAESIVERKGQADSAVPSAQPSPPGSLTSVLGRSKSDSTSSAFTAETQAEPPRYYVCSIDGSRVELKPPIAPAPGTLPESLASTCVARGKLPLLLDLDNTLLHAQAAVVTGCDVRLQDWLDEMGEPELFRFELSCNRKSYYMKLRPHLRTFLRVLEPYYEMSVYTNATQEYADIVVAILDENRQLFSDRIVARNSGFRGEASENKAVRRMYENMDKRCIVAFDDRQNIWTDLPLSHVVKAQHYDFFDSHRAELNAYYPPLPTSGSNGCGLSSIDALGRISDEIGVGLDLGLPDDNQQQNEKQLLKAATSEKKPCDWDKHLDCMLKLFLHIHAEFFRDPAKANIGAILSTVQQGVLSGVGIFFTGYRKTYSPGAAVADCEERQAELAQRLGAKVYKRFDEDGVTHVVAGKNNTNNMLACRENTKLSRVHTLWLYCCEAALTRVPEAAFEADALCAYYENCPPTSPYRDHWIHLAQKDRTNDEKVGSPNTSKAEIATGSKDACPWLNATQHHHHPLPPQDSLPVREFLGTGPYSDGATLTSPYEEIVFIWRPDKQTVRQLYGEDTRGAAAPSAPGILNIPAPFGSIGSNTGVLLSPVKPGLAGGTSNITSSTNSMGHTDMHVPGVFGERPVEASISTPSLHAPCDEGLVETRRVNVLVHGTCAQMHVGLPL